MPPERKNAFFDEEEEETQTESKQGKTTDQTKKEGSDEAKVASADREESATDYKALYEEEMKRKKQEEAFRKIAPYEEIGDPGQWVHTERFRELIDHGLSPEEAYGAVKATERDTSTRESKSHVGEPVMRKASGASRMSRDERKLAREFFGDEVSDETLEKLWRDTKQE